MTVMTPEFMSSDHSCSESEDTLETKPLEWRSRKVTQFFYNLDEHSEKGKSAQSKKQTKPRVLSDCPSTRHSPAGKIPSWAVRCS